MCAISIIQLALSVQGTHFVWVRWVERKHIQICSLVVLVETCKGMVKKVLPRFCDAILRLPIPCFPSALTVYFVKSFDKIPTDWRAGSAATYRPKKALNSQKNITEFSGTSGWEMRWK